MSAQARRGIAATTLLRVVLTIVSHGAARDVGGGGGGGRGRQAPASLGGCGGTRRHCLLVVRALLPRSFTSPSASAWPSLFISLPEPPKPVAVAIPPASSGE